jgi:hypothetical protein
MKTKFLVFLVLLTNFILAQDSMSVSRQRMIPQYSFDQTKHRHVIGFSPMSRKIEKVNGMVFGVGHIDNRFVEKQTINGLNLEVNPAPAIGALMTFMAIMYLPEIIDKNVGKKRELKVKDTLYVKEDDLVIKNWYKTPYLKLNGLNISSGCFFTTTSMNGLNISFANKFKDFNGISITPLGTMSDNQNGISLGLINASNDLNGFVVGVYNQSFKLDGLQIGLVNRAGINHGLQIGLVNSSRTKGFQVGVWNKNAKRSLPILNW